MVEVDSQSFGVIILSAPILAQAGAERIGRKVQQTEVRKPPEQACLVRNVLVDTGYELSVVSAAAAGRGKVIDGRAGVRRSDEIFIPQRSRSLAELSRRNLIIYVRRA